MVEFCKKCEGMMLPSKYKNANILVYNPCGQTKPLEKEIIKSYKLKERNISSTRGRIQEFRKNERLEKELS